MSPKGTPASRGAAADGAAGPPDAPSFEVALARLEEIVTRLERGEITLDDSLAAFKEGSSLVRHCLARLSAAEAAVLQLAEGSAGDTLKPFDASGATGGEPGTHD